VHGLLWMNWTGGMDDCRLVLMNADDAILEELVRKHEGSSHYRLMNLKGSFFSDFSLKRYPFDEQELSIELEDPGRSRDQLRIIPEPAAKRGGRAPGLAPSCKLRGWRFISGETLQRPRSYRVDLGTGKIPENQRFVYSLRVRRNWKGYIWRVVLPLTVIVAVVFLGFLLPPERVDVSVGLVVTCLLATIALHLTQASSMPNVGFLVAGDYVFMVGYVLLFLALAERILSHIWYSRGKEKRSRWMNRLAVTVFPSSMRRASP
jgi:hypothetical protein